MIFGLLKSGGRFARMNGALILFMLAISLSFGLLAGASAGMTNGESPTEAADDVNSISERVSANLTDTPAFYNRFLLSVVDGAEDSAIYGYGFAYENPQTGKYLGYGIVLAFGSFPLWLLKKRLQEFWRDIRVR